MNETKRKTVTAGTVTVKSIKWKTLKKIFRRYYTTHEEEIQEVMAKIVCCFFFWIAYGVVMYALYYICCVKG